MSWVVSKNLIFSLSTQQIARIPKTGLGNYISIKNHHVFNVILFYRFIENDLSFFLVCSIIREHFDLVMLWHSQSNYGYFAGARITTRLNSRKQYLRCFYINSSNGFSSLNLGFSVSIMVRSCLNLFLN